MVQYQNVSGEFADVSAIQSPVYVSLDLILKTSYPTTQFLQSI